MITVLFKISLAVFIAGNLLEMGLKLNPKQALLGLKNLHFVAHTLFWGFVVGPALAYAITLIIPLKHPYAIGLILLGMTPGAPFLPMFIDKVKGDLGYTAAFMLIVSVGTVIFMPFAVPLMIKGLTVTTWAIAKPLVIIILIPLSMGMLILHFFETLAVKIQKVVKNIVFVITFVVCVLGILIYWKGIISVAGSYALAAQIILFLILTTFTYWFGFGLKHEQKMVMSIGMSTRNMGAALAPLLSIEEIDQRSVIMVVLVMPIMVLFGWLSIKWFGHISKDT